MIGGGNGGKRALDAAMRGRRGTVVRKKVAAPGQREVVCTEELQPKRTEKLSCLRFPKVSVRSHVMQRNGRCFRWGPKEEFTGLL